MAQSILVTGGAGFIGSALVHFLIRETDCKVVVLDKLTYSGHRASLAQVETSPRLRFIAGDILDLALVQKIMREEAVDAVMHLAAESHVDRSIDGPGVFIQTNIQGTYTLLEASRSYLQELSIERRQDFRFLHVSTDEVYGSLGASGYFTESSSYQPNSPYSASKAASDHLVRAWHHTFGLPTMITNCSNNYGPCQFPEKLIPLCILNALAERPLPVYGRGEQIRDWLYVEDHVRALHAVLSRGRPGEVYNIGGHNEWRNIDVVRTLCELMDELHPRPHGKHAELITFVQDRPGHDLRYAIDAAKIEAELGWRPQETFASGLRKTVQWYLTEAEGWCRVVQGAKAAATRIGTAATGDAK